MIVAGAIGASVIGTGLTWFVVLRKSGVISTGGGGQAEWNAAVAQLCQEVGLEPYTHAGWYSSTSGWIMGRSIANLGIDSGRLQIVISAGGGDGLLIKGRNSPELRKESEAGPPTPIGDPQFDELVELRGAPPALLGALQAQPALRELVVQCVSRGICVQGPVFVRTKAIPRTAAEIHDYLDPMMDLARRIEDPTAAFDYPPLGTPAAARMRLIEETSSDEQAAQQHQAFFAEVGQGIGPGQAYVLPNDGTVEWRGTAQGIPVRIKLSGRDVEIEAMVQNPHGDISLSWDPDKAQQQAPQDVWSQNQETYLFVGKGVYLNGMPAEVDLEAARLRTLGPEAVPAMVRAMTGDQISSFRVQSQRITAAFKPELQEMVDPEHQLTRTAQLVGWLAGVVQSTPADPAIAQAQSVGLQAAQVAPLQKITCSYCSTTFLLQGNVYQCPNCGAPAQG